MGKWVRAYNGTLLNLQHVDAIIIEKRGGVVRIGADETVVIADVRYELVAYKAGENNTYWVLEIGDLEQCQVCYNYLSEYLGALYIPGEDA